MLFVYSRNNLAEQKFRLLAYFYLKTKVILLAMIWLLSIAEAESFF